MKLSKRFSDAVKESLAKTNKKCKKKTLTEAGGGGTYMPAGLNAISHDPVNRNGMPPYSLYTDISSRLPGGGIKQQPDEETKAPPRFPYPLETVLDHLADGYINLKNVESQIKSSFNNPMIKSSKPKTTELKAVHNKIRTILGNIKKIGQEIQKINLD